MKDQHDNQTADMHATAPRRGRPPTGTAKSAAQRKREQRRRDATRPVKEWSMEALLQAISAATQAGDVGKLAAGCAELKRRAELAARQAEAAQEVYTAADPVDAWLDLAERDMNAAFQIADELDKARPPELRQPRNR